MDSTWWTSADQIDSDQKDLIEIPIDSGNVLVTGPPGSGKTNVLLLRASYLQRAGHGNFLLLVFTRALREFIASGANHPKIVPPAKILTHAKWSQDLLLELGRPFAPTRSNLNHDDARREKFESLNRAITELQLPNDYYDSILLDEVQDYWACEIELFSKLTKRMFVVGDRNQRVYDRSEGLVAAERVGCREYPLKYHYRMGRKICVVGDRLRIMRSGDESLQDYCQYDERANPSKVEVHSKDSRDAEFEALQSTLMRQLRAYPEEWLGVITATKDSRDKVARFLGQGPLAKHIAIQGENVTDRGFDESKRIVVSTLHSAKGVEFRAVHIVATDEFPKYTREKAFTAITRAKTALDVYHSASIAGSLDSALATRGLPDLEDLFS